MRLLVLGGTQFLSRAVAAEAVDRGHDVTCAARGESGTVPEGARLVHLDRSAPDFSELARTWDAVVDVARDPEWVRAAVTHLRSKRWLLVSTISVYAETDVPDQTPANGVLTAPLETASPEAYGGNKVACEQAMPDEAFIVRPGLIVGPGDPTGRYSYWPARLADDGPVLAPGDPERLVQVIDVRDLATWIVRAAEHGTTGTYDGVGPTTTMADLLAASGSNADLVWVPQDFLTEQGVEPWAGPRSLPLWLPLPEYAGMLRHDPTPSITAGLVVRPLAETAADTLAWLRAEPTTTTGLTREEERTVLAAWLRPAQPPTAENA